MTTSATTRETTIKSENNAPGVTDDRERFAGRLRSSALTTTSSNVAPETPTTETPTTETPTTARTRAPIMVAQATRQPASPVTVNIFDLGVAPRLPQDPVSRGVRGLADGIGHVVGEVFDLPDGTPASREAPMAVHALRQQGVEVGANGNITLPNTREAGAMLADVVVEAHAPGDLALVRGVYGLNKFTDPQTLRNAGFGDDFIAGFSERSRSIARDAGLTSLAALFGLAGGVAGARNNPPPMQIVNPRSRTIYDIPRGAGSGRSPVDLSNAPGTTIDLRPGANGVYQAGTGAAGTARSGGITTRPGAVTTNPGAVTVPGAAVGVANNGLGNRGSAIVGNGAVDTVPGARLGSGSQVYGPGDADGVAQLRADVARRNAQRTADLDARSAARPVPTVQDGAALNVGRYPWDDAGRVAAAHNSGGDLHDIIVRVPVDRNYGDGAQRREVGLLRGDAIGIENQVSAMRDRGMIPQDFDLAGAARQAGVDWSAARTAAANVRAYPIAASNPLTLNGGRTFAFPDARTAQSETLAFNGRSSGAGDVALYVPVNRTVDSGRTRATGTSHEVFVGDPATLRNTYGTLRDQGRIADNASFDTALDRAGIAGSLASRSRASLDLRAAEGEVGFPTTLFGSTSGVTPTAGESQAAAVSANRDAAPGEPLVLSIPLLRDVSAPGLPAGARGVAHALYQNTPENLRGFYDEMNRQGRIPAGVTFDSLLQQSGIAGRYAQSQQTQSSGQAEPAARGDDAAVTSATPPTAGGVGGLPPGGRPPRTTGATPPEPDGLRPEELAARLPAARITALDALPDVLGPVTRTLDDGQSARLADVLGQRIATETDGTRPAMVRRLEELAADPEAVESALRTAGIDLPALPIDATNVGGARLEPSPQRIVQTPSAEPPAVVSPQRPDTPRTIVPGVLDTTTMGPIIDLPALLPAARRIGAETLPSIIGARDAAALTLAERGNLEDALAHALAARPNRTEEGMRAYAAGLAQNPAAVAELRDVATSMLARDLVDEAMTDPAKLDPAMLQQLSPTELGRIRSALADQLTTGTDGSEAGLRAAIARFEPNTFVTDLVPERTRISLAQSVRVDRETFVGALGYARNRIEATPSAADYQVYTPGLEDTTPSRTIPIREIRPRENDPSQPVLNFVNDQVLGNPLVRAALQRNGIDAVYMSESGIRTGISGLGSQTRQFTEVDTALQTVRHGLGDIAGAAARGDWNGAQAAVADFVRDLDRNSDQAFRPNRGTIAEVVQAPGVTQMLQLGATMGPGLLNDQLPALPGEMARSLFVEMSAKNNLYEEGGTGGLVPIDAEDPSAGYRLNVAYDQSADQYVLLAPLRVKSINQAEVLLQLPEALNPAQIPFVGGLYPSVEVRTMDYVGPNAGYFDLPPGTRFTPRQVALLNEGIVDPALFSEAGQDPDVHRELMRTFEALALPGLNTNIRNRDDPFTEFTPDHPPGVPYRLRTDFEIGVSLTLTPAAGTPVAPLSKFFPIGVTPFRGGIGGVFKFDVFPTPPGVSRVVDMDEQAQVRDQSTLAGVNERLPQSVTMFRLPPELQTGEAAARQSTLFVSIPSAAALPFADGTRTWTRHSEEALMSTLNQLDAANRGETGAPGDPALEQALNRAYLVFGREPGNAGSGITGEQREALRGVVRAELQRAQRLMLADEDGTFGATLGGSPPVGDGPTATPESDLDTDL